MLTERLRARCPSATPLTPAVLAGHTLSFSKVGMDGSGKATPRPAAKAALHGVLFTIAMSDQPALDHAEGAGKGYDRVMVDVRHARTEEAVCAATYIATALDASLKPYHWYHALVLGGAVQHRLPSAHRDTILGFPSVEDREIDRKDYRTAIRVLRQAGFSDLP